MTRYAKSKQECLRERVYKFYLDNQSKGKYFTYLHFKAEKMPKSTIYNIIQRAENRLGSKRKIGSGRIPKIMDTRGKRKLKDMFNHSDKVSQRQAAKSFKCSQPYICQTLRKHTDIRKRQKMTIPMRTEEQKSEAKTRCGRLYRKFKNLCWILHDESIFTLSNSSTSLHS